MKLSDLFDVRTKLGLAFFFIWNLLSIIPAIYLTVSFVFAAVFHRNTLDEIYQMVGLLFVNLILNYVIARKSEKWWLFMLGGTSILFGGTVLYWLIRNNF